MAKKWLQKAINPKHAGYCTPMTKSTCTPARKALARRLKPGGDLYSGKKQKKPKGKQSGGLIEKLGGIASIVGTGLEITGAIGDSVTKAMIDKILAGSPEDTDIRSASDAVRELKRRQSGVRRAETTGSLISLNPGRILGSLLGAKSGRRIESRERRGLKEDLSNEALARYLSGQASTEYCRGGRIKKYKSGGKIKGKGTGTSDSISMKSKEGSFIVPAKNNRVAMELGRTYLGWGKNQSAIKKKKGGIAIRASNGEVEYNPAETKKLLAEGINLNRLAPDSETPLKFRLGGKVRRKKKKHPSAAKAAEMLENPPRGKKLTGKQEKYFRALEHGWEPSYQDGGEVTEPLEKIKSIPGKVSYAGRIPNPTITGKMRSKKFIPKKGIGKKILGWTDENLPEILGGLQAGIAGISLLRMGEGPRLTVADELKAMARDTRRQAQYGLEPFIANKAREDIVRSRNEMIRTLSGRGGGGQELAANLAVAGRAYSEGIIELSKADFAAQESKRSVHRGIMKDIAMRKHDIQADRRRRFERDEEALGAMLASGIENIVGARKYKEHLDFLKKTAYDPTKILPGA